MGHEINKVPSSKPITGISERCRRQVKDAGEVECPDKSSSSSSSTTTSCKSCTARVIADCVAICCCPCALVNFFTLTLVKVPYMMGRKCLSNFSKKKKLKNDARNNISKKDDNDEGENPDLGTQVTAIVNEDETGSSSNKYSARFEAERVWLELYRVDNLGFGRVSFNGIQSLG